jgi:hypothetical protein
MFASMVIRKLARSEEMFAETHNFVGLGAHLKGPSTSTPCRQPSMHCSRRTRFSRATSSGAPTGGISSSSMT